MIRIAIAAAALLAIATPAAAVEFEADDSGAIEFVMPSGNIGCTYTPAGGTGTFMPVDGGPELRCDRVEPTYVRVILGPKGKPQRYNDVGDASCCGATNVFAYGETWEMGPFSCESEPGGLSCTRGSNGFLMSRRKIRTH